MAIDWQDSLEGVPVKTYALLQVLIDDIPIWPMMGDARETVGCFVDDVLSHLVECWKALALRQTYPVPVQPEKPSLLRAEAEKRWGSCPPAQVVGEQERVLAFEDVHNFANAFSGVFGLPPLWLMRLQEQMIAETDDRVWWIPYGDTIECLGATGDAIANRLRAIGSAQWDTILNSWARRNEGGQADLLAWSIGVDKNIADGLIAHEVLKPPTSVADAANDDDELRIAARMAGSLSLEQIERVVYIVRDCEPRSTDVLDKFTSGLWSYFRDETLMESYPYRQGVAAASWLRNQLGLPPKKRADPFAVLDQLGVDIRLLTVSPTTLYAIAVWGKRHGPAVVLNEAGPRFRRDRDVKRTGAARVTGAHELCHLLLDRDHPFAAVEILQSRVPLRMEQRARAFAAEFLFPAHIAAWSWQRAGCPLDLESMDKFLKRTCTVFGVTRSVASWQLEHGADQHIQQQISVLLDEVVPQRRASFILGAQE